jgi:hypothetical protein
VQFTGRGVLAFLSAPKREKEKEMIIRSPRPESKFSIISNEVVRDRRLSYKARGILLELLSRPDNWRIDAKGLETDLDGRAAVLSALRELREFGYLVTKREHDKKGQFMTQSWVFDRPQPSTITPESGFPHSDNPKSDNRTPLEEPIKKNLKDMLDNGFEEFWKVYPRREGIKTARASFLKALKSSDLQTILDGARKYAKTHKEIKFCLLPTSWLNQERWNDESQSDIVFTPSPTPPPFTEADIAVGVPIPKELLKSLRLSLRADKG